MPRVYNPPKIGKSSAEHQTRGIFVGLGRFICWVFWDSHKIHLGRLASFDVSIFCFFLRIIFFRRMQVWVVGAPRLNLYWREVTVLPAGKHFAYQVASMPINLRSTVANVSTARPTISQRTCGFGTCLPKILGCLIYYIWSKIVWIYPPAD